MRWRLDRRAHALRSIQLHLTRRLILCHLVLVMRVLRRSRTTTCWLILAAVFLGGALGVADHEHAAWSVAKSASCALDHEDLPGARDGEGDNRAGAARAERSRASHEHDCVACHLSRTRCDQDSRGAAFGPGSGGGERIVALPQQTLPRSGWSVAARGPPVV